MERIWSILMTAQMQAKKCQADSQHSSETRTECEELLQNLQLACTTLCISDGKTLCELCPSEYLSIVYSILCSITNPATGTVFLLRPATYTLRFLALIAEMVPMGPLSMATYQPDLTECLAGFLKNIPYLVENAELTEELLKCLCGLTHYGFKSLIAEDVLGLVMQLEPQLAEWHLRMHCYHIAVGILRLMTHAEWTATAAAAAAALVNNFDQRLSRQLASLLPSRSGEGATAPRGAGGLSAQQQDAININCGCMALLCERIFNTPESIKQNEALICTITLLLLKVLRFSLVVRRAGDWGLQAPALGPFMALYLASPSFFTTLLSKYGVLDTLCDVALRLLGSCSGKSLAAASHPRDLSNYFSRRLSSVRSRQNVSLLSPQHPRSTDAELSWLARDSSDSSLDTHWQEPNGSGDEGEANSTHGQEANNTSISIRSFSTHDQGANLLVTPPEEDNRGGGGGGGRRLSRGNESVSGADDMNTLSPTADELTVLFILEFLLAVVPSALRGHSHDDFLTLTYAHYGWYWEDSFHNFTLATERLSCAAESTYLAQIYPTHALSNGKRKGISGNRRLRLWVKKREAGVCEMLLRNGSSISLNLARMLYTVDTSRTAHAFIRNLIIDGFQHSRLNGFLSGCRCILSQCGTGKEPQTKHEKKGAFLDYPARFTRTGTTQVCNCSARADTSSGTHTHLPGFAPEGADHLMANGGLQVETGVGSRNDTDGSAKSNSGATKPLRSNILSRCLDTLCCFSAINNLVACKNRGDANHDSRGLSEEESMCLEEYVTGALFGDVREAIMTACTTRAAFTQFATVKILISTLLPTLVVIVRNSITPLVARHCCALILRCLSLTALFCTSGDDTAGMDTTLWKVRCEKEVEQIADLMAGLCPSLASVLYYLFFACRDESGQLSQCRYPLKVYKSYLIFTEAFTALDIAEKFSHRAFTIRAEIRVSAADAIVLLTKLMQMFDRGFGHHHNYGCETGVHVRFPALFTEGQRSLLCRAAEERIVVACDSNEVSDADSDKPACPFHPSLRALKERYVSALGRLVKVLCLPPDPLETADPQLSKSNLASLDIPFKETVSVSPPPQHAAPFNDVIAQRHSSCLFAGHTFFDDEDPTARADDEKELVEGSLVLPNPFTKKPELTLKVAMLNRAQNRLTTSLKEDVVLQMLEECMRTMVNLQPLEARPLVTLRDAIRAKTLDLRAVMMQMPNVLITAYTYLHQWVLSRAGGVDKITGILPTERESLSSASPALCLEARVKLTDLLAELTAVVLEHLGLAQTNMPSQLITSIPFNYWRFPTKSNQLGILVEELLSTPLILKLRQYDKKRGREEEEAVDLRDPTCVTLTNTDQKEVTLNGQVYHLHRLSRSLGTALVLPNTTVSELRYWVAYNLALSGRGKDKGCLRMPLDARVGAARQNLSSETLADPHSYPFTLAIRKSSGRDANHLLQSGDLFTAVTDDDSVSSQGGTQALDCCAEESVFFSMASDLAEHVLLLIEGVPLLNPLMTVIDAICQFSVSGRSLREFQCDEESALQEGSGVDYYNENFISPGRLAKLQLWRLSHTIDVVMTAEHLGNWGEAHMCGCAGGAPCSNVAPSEDQHPFCNNTMEKPQGSCVERVPFYCTPIHIFKTATRQQDVALCLIQELTVALHLEEAAVPHQQGEHRRLSSIMMHAMTHQLSLFRLPILLHIILQRADRAKHRSSHEGIGIALWADAGQLSQARVVSHFLWNYPRIFSFEVRIGVLHMLLNGRQSMSEKRQKAILNSAQRLEAIFIGLDWVHGEMNLDREKVALVNRESVLQCGHALLHFYATYPHKISVRFKNEPGVGIGPTNEFFELLGRELCKVERCLWRTEAFFTAPGQAGGVQWRVSELLFPTVYQLRGAAAHYELLGLLTARLILHGRVLPLRFHPLFLRALVGESLTSTPEAASKHLAALDPDFEHSLQQLEGMSAEELSACELTFVLPSSELCPPELAATPIALIEGGTERLVTAKNVLTFTSLVRSYVLSEALNRALAPFRAGLHSFLPPIYLTLFTATELSLVLSGPIGKIWVNRRAFEKDVVASHGYTMSSPVVQYLLEIIPEWTSQEQRGFLKFVTGSTSLPVGGLPFPITVVQRGDTLAMANERPGDLIFAEINSPVGSGGQRADDIFNDEEAASISGLDSAIPLTTERFDYALSITAAPHTLTSLTTEMAKSEKRALPTVSTCFHYLKLPAYASREILERRLRYAIDGSSDYFAFS